MYVSVSDDARPTDDFVPSESPSPQGKSENVRLASLELEELLSSRFAEDGVHVQTIASEVMLIQSLVLAILSLFEGYLALGLLVGVAGLSIVTIRQVSERRQTIGMLRAIGFRRAQVMGAFSVETAWVCLLGMLNGWLVGYGFHRSVHLQLWDGQGVDFVFPWVRVMSIFVVAIIIVVVSLYPTLRKAAHIQPSDALRQR